MDLKDRVVEMKEEVESLRNEINEKSLAMDLLKELKAQNKRQHITNIILICVIIILICVIVSMIIGFFIYEQQFETVSEETTVDGGNGTATYLQNSNTGDINYGENK